MNEIEKINKQRNEVLKRIEEKQRLIELIKNQNVKNTRNPIQLFNKIKAVTKIQNAFRGYYTRKVNKLNLEKEKANAKYKFNLSVNKVNLDLLTTVLKIQRKFRNFLFQKNKEKMRAFYLNVIRANFFQPIPMDRQVELKKELMTRLASARIPSPEEYKYIINMYYESYKNFCLSFPKQHNLREENFLYYYQCLELLKYMEHLKEVGLAGNPFKVFVLNKNKIPQVKRRVDRMEEAHEHKAWWYDEEDIDDFEENNLLDEIDARYNLKKRSLILNGQ